MPRDSRVYLEDILEATRKIMAYTGVSKGLVDFATNAPVAPIVIIIFMQIVCIFLGMFLAVTPIIMIFVPLYIPIVEALGFDTVWFSAIFLLNMEMGTISPPFGLGLFAMKGVAPPDVTMGDVFRAALPFLYLDAFVMALMLVFPQLVLWLPNLMGGR